MYKHYNKFCKEINNYRLCNSNVRVQPMTKIRPTSQQKKFIKLKLIHTPNGLGYISLHQVI